MLLPLSPAVICEVVFCSAVAAGAAVSKLIFIVGLRLPKKDDVHCCTPSISTYMFSFLIYLSKNKDSRRIRRQIKLDMIRLVIALPVNSLQ